MAPTYTGSCKCSAIQITLEGEPSFVGLCHCLNCRKSTSSAYSTNAVFSNSALNIIQGKPKVYEVTGGSGNPAHVHFCEHCGSTMWTSTAARAEIVVIKIGILDGDAMDRLVPVVEIFASRRPKWGKSIDGAAQCPEAFQPPTQS